MRIRYAPAVLALIFFLAACGRSESETLTLSVTLDAIGQERAQELLQSAHRMLQRRVVAIAAQQNVQIREADVQIEQTNGSSKLAVKVGNANVLRQLATEIHTPFTIQFMEEVPLDMAEVVVAETQGFRGIPLTDADIAWLHIIPRDGEDGVQAVITFTDGGAEQKRQLFAERLEQNIGIFVRGMPVYKMLVEPHDVAGDALAINIPHAELAEVFVDDVNVGLRATFSVVE